MDLDIFFKITYCLRTWLQHTIYGASLLTNVVTLVSSRILYLVRFAQVSIKIGDK